MLQVLHPTRHLEVRSIGMLWTPRCTTSRMVHVRIRGMPLQGVVVDIASTTHHRTTSRGPKLTGAQADRGAWDVRVVLVRRSRVLLLLLLLLAWMLSIRRAIDLLLIGVVRRAARQGRVAILLLLLLLLLRTTISMRAWPLAKHGRVALLWALSRHHPRRVIRPTPDARSMVLSSCGGGGGRTRIIRWVVGPRMRRIV